MELSDFINNKYENPKDFSKKYISNKPFPHIIFNNFFNTEMLSKVVSEFPDLSLIKNKHEHKNENENKFISLGSKDLSNSAFNLISVLN